MDDELLSCKDLAQRLKRSPHYVYQMRRLGFRMVAGRTTLKAALVWLAQNPNPFSPQRRKM